MSRNHEVTTEQPLLTEKGELREPGWSRTMVQWYDRTMIKAPRNKIKEWDYYLVMGKDFAGAFTISDDGYIGLQSVSLLDFSGTGSPGGSIPADGGCWEHTETVLNAFPRGKFDLSADSGSGTNFYADKRLKIAFDVDLNDEDGPGGEEPLGERHIRVRFEKFCDKKPFECDIRLQQEPTESMVIATPWKKKHAFYYNQKINCMRASGWIEFDGKRYEFDPATDFGTLDWGRGVWTYDNTWYWGSGNADIDGHAFGFNLGYGFGDTSASTENVIVYDGIVHKLDDVEFILPDEGYTDPWVVTSSDGRFEADFVPIMDRAAKINFKVLVSDQHQVFGRMTGKAILDDGTEIQMKDLLCFIEKVHNRY